MSIIYEALKKIEAGSHKSPEIKTEAKPKTAPKIYLLYALVICLGFLLTNLVFHLFSQPALIKATAPKPAEIREVVKPLPAEINRETTVSLSPPASAPQADRQIDASAFILNGIFFSENEGYALINNQIVKTGDSIEGLKVIRIGANEVELASEGSTLKLRVSR
jgi:hypothetical protein